MVATSLIGFLMMLKASRMDQLIKEAELRRTLPLGKA